MAKVLFRKLDSRNGKRRKSRLAKTRVRDASGKAAHFFMIDANSPTFERDLTTVYKANVAAARSENRKLFGSADGVRKASRRAK